MDWRTHVKWGPLMTGISITVLVVISLAITCSEEVSGALTDDESSGNMQYQEWTAAYNLTETDLGSKLLIRKDGGADVDFLRMSFLSIGDLITFEIEHPIDDAATLEYYVSDPNRFPIRYHVYDGTGTSIVRLEFLVTLAGPYFFHTGSGFGDTIFSVNITRVSTSSTGDENDRPEDAVEISSSTIIHDNFGQPHDPSDFFMHVLAPSETKKVFLRFTLFMPEGAEGQWELYTSSGIERGSRYYTADCRYADSEITFYDRIMSPDIYYIRVWCNEGDGDYTLSIKIDIYPNDGNDLLVDALEIFDGDDFNETLHTEYDLKDHFKINLYEGDHLQLWLYVDDDADLLLLNGTGLQLSISDNWNDDSEYISYTIPPGGEGYYHILVKPSSELDPKPLRKIMYRLRTLVSLPPLVDNDYSRTLDNWQIAEDTVDDRVELARLFLDPEGGPLTFTVIADFNEILLDVTVTAADRLRFEPGENLSGFTVPVTVVAMDNRGKMANFTIQVTVIPVNDAPVVGHPSLPPPPESLEIDEDVQGGPWDALDWFWDVDNDRMDLNILLTPSSEVGGTWNGFLFLYNRVPDWSGNSNITLTARDPKGLEVDLRILVIVRPVNDPPRNMGPDLVIGITEVQAIDIDLFNSFVEVDGEAMSFDGASTASIDIGERGGILTVNGFLRHQNETVVIIVTAMDIHGATSQPLKITLEVGELPDPHSILATVDAYSVIEGSAQMFMDFEIVDPDPKPSHYDLLLRAEGKDGLFHLFWTKDSKYWTEGEPTWTPEVLLKDRDVLVTLFITDEWYNESVSWTVHVRRGNSPPREVRITPDSQGPYTQSEVIALVGYALDDDGDIISFNWILDGGEEVGQGGSVNLSDLSIGAHEVTLVVHDGIDGTETVLSFEVIEDEEHTSGEPFVDTWMASGIVILLVLGLVVGALMIRRDRARVG